MLHARIHHGPKRREMGKTKETRNNQTMWSMTRRNAILRHRLHQSRSGHGILPHSREHQKQKLGHLLNIVNFVLSMKNPRIFPSSSPLRESKTLWPSQRRAKSSLKSGSSPPSNQRSRE